MFDVTVAAPWPRGLYLCKKLQETGKKVCYLETPSEGLNPAGLFLSEEEENADTKSFLLSLGSLEKQQGGFCIVSEQGVLSFQEKDLSKQNDTPFSWFYRKEKSGIYRKDWLHFFAQGFLSRVFEFNNSVFDIKSLNLHGDYYLFKLSLKQRKQFQKDNPNICFMNTNSSGWEIKKEGFFIREKFHESKKVFSFFEPSFKTLPPDWLWDHAAFYADLKDYDTVIPLHFVLINQLQCPWVNGNLLSVLKKSDGEWDVYFRRPFTVDSMYKERLKQEVASYLEAFFKIPFHFVREGKKQGFAVYGGRKSLSYLNQERPGFLYCQENPVEWIKWEKKVFQKFL